MEEQRVNEITEEVATKERERGNEPQEVSGAPPRIHPAGSLTELLDGCPCNKTIGDNLIRAWDIINDPKHQKIVCSISGGADSDVMLDICYRCDKDSKIDYVWFDTGLEYQATKDHLRYLEQRYRIEIKPFKAIKAIPTTCREYGQPFVSKRVSEYIWRLQSHNFQWKDEEFDNLYAQYPNCKSALRWYTNTNQSRILGIAQNRFLKEFILQNPPQFNISPKCCDFAKKRIAHNLLKDNQYDLNIVGVRKLERGSRAITYHNCFTENDDAANQFRPLFWYSDSDRLEYEQHYNIVHSKCYTEYGLQRTGCAGCPFGRNFEYELEVIQKYEPKLYVAVNNIFGDSYEYTRQYRAFADEMRVKERAAKKGFT